MAKVAVCLINFQNAQDTLECLDSLAHLETKHQVSLLVASHDKEKNNKQLCQHSTKPQVLDQKKNLGFAGFNNVMLETAFKNDADVVVLLNNDTLVSPAFLDDLVETAQRSTVGLVSPKIYFAKGDETYVYKKSQLGKVIWYAGGVIDWLNVFAFHRGVDEVDRGQFDKVVKTDFATGCCIAISRQAYYQIGGMPTDYFMYLEDVVWSVKAKELGLKVLYQPRSVIWHKNAGSTGGSGSEFHRYYQTRNRILFGLRYAAMRTKLALLKQAIFQLQKGEAVEKKAVWDALLGRKGMRDIH